MHKLQRIKFNCMQKVKSLLPPTSTPAATAWGLEHANKILKALLTGNFCCAFVHEGVLQAGIKVRASQNHECIRQQCPASTHDTFVLCVCILEDTMTV